MRLVLLVPAAAGLAGCARAAEPAITPLPRPVLASYLGGKLAAYEGDWDAAADALARAADAAPDQPIVAVELARAQMKAHRTPAALATLARARRRWPDHPQVWMLSGDALAPDDPAEATRAYRRAITLAPDDERGYLGLARLQPAAAAEATLKTLIAHVPASVDGHYRLAVRLAMRGELASSSRELRAVLERDPDHIDARLDLARALRRQGHLEQAIAETRSAFDRSGQALDIAEELFDLLCEADDRGAAIDLLTLLDDDHSDADALAVIARLERGLGRLAEARALAARIAVIDHDAGAIALAETQLAAGDRPGVTSALSAIEPGSRRATEARRLLAEAALAADDPAAALSAIGPAAADTLDTALVAAFALADLGRRAEAQARLARPDLARDGDARDALVLARARLAARAGDAASALGILESLIRGRPDLVAALNLAGYLLADAGQRLADAERYLRHARELVPGDPGILDSWGYLLLRRGDARNAVRALDRAARFAPLEPEILVHLAAAWAADGAPRTAAQILDRAAALAPPRTVQKRIAAVRQTLPAPPRQ